MDICRERGERGEYNMTTDRNSQVQPDPDAIRRRDRQILQARAEQELRTFFRSANIKSADLENLLQNLEWS